MYALFFFFERKNYIDVIMPTSTHCRCGFQYILSTLRAKECQCELKRRAGTKRGVGNVRLWALFSRIVFYHILSVLYVLIAFRNEFVNLSFSNLKKKMYSKKERSKACTQNPFCPSSDGKTNLVCFFLITTVAEAWLSK